MDEAEIAAVEDVEVRREIGMQVVRRIERVAQADAVRAHQARRRRESEDGLAELLGDVLSEGTPDPALLVRYADDPKALSSEERQVVEKRLAESPQYRDQLRVLLRTSSDSSRTTRH